MMAWRVARALLTLRDQVNAAAPNRSRDSDGTIGDTAHAAGASDHNPNSAGVVTAMDITHDPAHGFNSWDFAEMLRKRRDSRIKYIISNGRIFSSVVDPWEWRKYTGSNKHDKHVHISVGPSVASYDDSRPWDIGGDWNAGSTAPPAPPAKPLLKVGSPYTSEVTALQRKLSLTMDGLFGPKTEAAVKAFQKANGLTADGLVGPYTREKLGI
jgi:peptidoglycan hydrolase-like protein with peptidoglycan-binding domain